MREEQCKKGEDHRMRGGFAEAICGIEINGLLSWLAARGQRVTSRRGWNIGSLVAVSVMSAPLARAQDNYEIQVYAYDTVKPGHTMVELHSNFTIDGSKTVQDGLLPANHAQHETIEITHGITDWFEMGFYIFTYQRNGFGEQWVGDHILPRVRIPPQWKWQLGLRLSSQSGYQRRYISSDTGTRDMRPIIAQRLRACSR